MKKKDWAVAVVKCDSYDSVDAPMKKLMELLGGIESYVKKDDRVTIKANLVAPLPPSHAATTHPAVAKSLIKLVKKQTRNIIIGDSSGRETPGSTSKSLKITGFSKLKSPYVKVLNFDSVNPVLVKIPNGKKIKETYFAEPMVESDLVINLPKLKTHISTLVTCAVKNLHGSQPGARKMEIHRIARSRKALPDALLDIALTVNPGLTIIDGIIGMEGPGPRDGTPKKAGLLIGSNNIIAAEIVSTYIIGYDPKDVPILQAAAKRGHNISFDNISLLGMKKEDIRRDFRRPKSGKLLQKIGDMFYPLVYKKMSQPKLNVDRSICKKCETCKVTCELDAITMRNFPEIDYRKCIRCWQCFENCPNNAMTVRPKFLGKVFSSLYKRQERRAIK